MDKELRQLLESAGVPIKEEVDGTESNIDFDDEAYMHKNSDNFDTEVKIGEEEECDDDEKETVEEDVVGDLNNGYGRHHVAQEEDYFPHSEHGSVSIAAGPSAAKQSDNPLQKASATFEVGELDEAQDIHKELVYAYRTFLKESER